MLESKKWKAVLVAVGVGVVVFLVSAFTGINSDEAIKWVGIIISPILLYIPSQGIADVGKERAKIEANQE